MIAVGLVVLLAVAQTPMGTGAMGADAMGADPVEEAKKYFEAGRQAYEAHDFQAAASAFEEAQKLSPRPAIVFSMAQAYRQLYFADQQLSTLRRAIDLYAQYLEQTPKGGRRNDAAQHLNDLQQTFAAINARGSVAERPPQQQMESKTQLMISSRTQDASASIDGSEPEPMPLIAEVEPGDHTIRVTNEGYRAAEVVGRAVEGRLVVVEVNLEELPAILRISAPDGSDISIDGRPVGQAPMLVPLEVPAGDHFVAVTAHGNHPFVRTMKLKRGEDVPVLATLETTTQRDISYYFIGGGAALFAATGVTVIVALISEGQARLIQRKLETQMVNLTIDERNEYNDLRGRRSDMITASSLLLAGSIALGVTGGLLYFLDTPGVQSRGAIPLTDEAGGKGTALVPLLSPELVGAAFSASF